jgi:hypothetical protein
MFMVFVAWDFHDFRCMITIMNIRFHVSKKYNHFFFVQTLADWHFSCRKEYSESWIEETGLLSEAETEALASFRKMISKYGFEPLSGSPAANAFDFFMRYDEFEDKTSFDKQDIEAYEVAMKTLEPRFEKIWVNESVKLFEMMKLLSSQFQIDKAQIISDLKTVFADHLETDRGIEVILLISTGEGGAGGANNGPDIITLECSSTELRDGSHLLSTIWHETIHLILDKYVESVALILNKDELIKEASSKAKELDFDYAKELIVFLLFSPMSYLVSKHFPTELSKKLSQAVEDNDTAWLLRAQYVFSMYLVYLNGQFIHDHIDGKKVISDREMAEAIVENHKIIKEFFKKNKAEVEWFRY